MAGLNVWLKRLAELTEKINCEGSAISLVVRKKATLQSDFFSSPITVSNLDERKNVPTGVPGLYVFTVTESVQLTYKQVQVWCSLEDKVAGFSQWGEKTFCAGDCFYVGSSITSLYQRLGHHFGPNGKAIPKGLALQHPTRQIMLGKVTAIVFPLKTEYTPYASLLLPRIEKVLHNILKPAAGTSRT